MHKAIIVKEGYPFIISLFIITIIVAFTLSVYWSIIPALLTLFVTFFFRSPHRNIPQDQNLILAPADGKVMGVTELENDDFVNEPCKKVTIFLSVFDVHVNFSPMAGKIKFQEYTCGRFLAAYKDSVGFENERHSIGIENGDVKILVTQIAGLIARRIVSWVTLGNVLEPGQKYGLIKFGSCTEVTVPRDVEILVKKGDRVVGGETVIGRINR